MRDILLLAAEIALAAVFTVAALSKLADPIGTRESMRAFGAPARTAATLAFGVPLAELAVAVAILFAQTVRLGAIGAGCLLVVFSAAIALNLARGAAPDCHCFGQLSSHPVGTATLVRNGVLLALAVTVAALAWDGRAPGAVERIGALGGAEQLALGATLIALATAGAAGYVLLSLLRAHGRVLLRIDALEQRLREEGIEVELPAETPELAQRVGSEAPEFTLNSDGSPLSLAELLGRRKPLLLMFVSPHCGPCHTALATATEWHTDHTDDVTFAVVSTGASNEARDLAEEHGLGIVLVDSERQAFSSYGVSGTPSAVLINSVGHVAAPLAAGQQAIQQLLSRAFVVQRGAVPPVALTRLDGTEAFLDQLLPGGESVVLFWNPDCRFCRAIADDVRAIEAAHDESTPRLVVISTGTAEATRSEAFRSPVALDSAHEAANAFDAHGTPMAVRINADGQIASPVAQGADQVLELIMTGSGATAPARN